ncbi:MAG: NAD(P)-binding domain-containing protein [Bacteriovoracaceae bacterium]|nr:NAD(P)-binding domain-containing protein [Bacteriovoracaceae bacterium]
MANSAENMIKINDIYKDLSFYLSENIELASYGFMGLFIFWLIIKSSYKNRLAIKDLKQAVIKNLHEPLTLHPVIDESLCMGCGDCTVVCPEGGSVLQLINHKAVLIKAAKCVGHGLCENACPVDAIDLVFGTKQRGMDIPRITSDYETNVAGLYIAGELGGMGLISNAVKQGQHAAEHALNNLKDDSDTDIDLFIVGAGPSGIAASLAAKKMKKSFVCIDQNTMGGAVYNFPRQKIVMVQPIVLPFEGAMKFKNNVVSKEELLEQWEKLVSKHKLKIREKEAFKGVSGQNGHFVVTTSKKTYTAKKVLLAMGVRGSPRKLGLPNEDMAKVAYNLIDPEQYQGKNVAIVGGGNAAVEAAQYLAKKQYKNKVTLIVRGDEDSGLKRCAEDNKVLLFKCVEQGNVQILYTSSVKGIEKRELLLKIGDTEKKINNDFIFVFAGAEMPHKFLMSLGIEIEKKYGSKLKAS